MYNIKIRNCGLLSYVTVQSKWSAQTMWRGLTAFIMMACVDRPRMLPQNIHNHVCTRLHGVLTQTTLQILTTVSTSNPVPKIFKNWNVDGKLGSAYDNLLMCTFQSILWGMDWESYTWQAEKAILFEYGWSCSFRQKEAEHYVRGDCVLTADCDRVIVCWQQIVIGWLCVDSRLW